VSPCHAYALDVTNKAVKPWTQDELAFYLRTGFHPAHGVSRGTMGLVTAELAFADPADVAAMARAIIARMAPSVDARGGWASAVDRAPLAPKGAIPESESATIYRTTCEGCHDGSRPPPFGGLALSRSTGLTGESPRNLINVILYGLRAAERGETTPAMPGYAGALSDAQVEALVAWLRTNLTNEAPWQDVAATVDKARKMDAAMLDFPPGGKGADPAKEAH